MPSLALNDPDMILPFDGSERESSTPSPPSQLVYLSNLNARYNPNDPHNNSGAGGVGSAVSTNTRPKKNFSRNWSHEDIGVANTRRLSDIGEELSPTRAEEFDKEPEQSQVAEEGSATPRGQTGSPDTKENDSNSSTPQANAGSARSPKEGGLASPHVAHEAAVSPAVSQKASPAQSQGELPNAALPAGNAIASAAVTAKGPGEDFSSAILSSEAERILDNAKKRLTLMEGNLNRARSTVRLTPSPSPSSPGYIQPINPNQPAGGLYRTLSRSDRRGSALRRQSFVTSQDASNRHNRVHSETNFPAESSLAPDAKRFSRSVSAMGVSTSSHFQNDDRSFQYEPTRSYLTHRASISSMKQPSFGSPGPVQSPQPGQSPQHGLSSHSHEDSSSDSPKGLGISTEDESKSSSSPVASSGQFSPVYSSYGPPSRAQSQLQVRDLQYQMKGLHIKISSLKVKNQEDNMRRRSIQSLRTPSPLTAADPWYTNGLDMRDGRSSRGSNAVNSPSVYSRDYRNSRNLSPPTYFNQHGYEQKEESPVDQSRGNVPTDQDQAAYDERVATAASAYEDAEEGEFDDGDIDREALDEILREPLDEDLESPMDEFPLGSHVDETPHEEREDAFDYEHFILHSALGNYSRHARHESRHSNATTRTHQRPRHIRNDSNISSGTDATFATATEGEELPEEEDDLMYWDRRFNHELRHRDDHEEDAEMETDRSETPRGYREDESGVATPVEGQSQARARDSLNNGSATPTSLAESLVSTVRAASAASPQRSSTTPTSGGINHDDTQMLEHLFQSLGNVCMDLQAITTSENPDIKAAKVLRRRLDAARRALDGELDA